MRRIALALGLLAAAACPAPAAFVTYFGEDLVNGNTAAPRPIANGAQAAFLGQLSGVTTQNFEGFPNGTPAPLVLTFGADTATLTGSGNTQNVPETGSFATSGTSYFRGSNFTGAFAITFSTPQAAFGFFATDLGDFGSQLSLTLTLAGGGTASLIVPHVVGSGGTPNGSVSFYGLIGQTSADTYTSITFNSTTGTTDVFGFDDMTIGRLSQVTPSGAATPLPPTALALAAGVPLLAGIARRRRAA